MSIKKLRVAGAETGFRLPKVGNVTAQMFFYNTVTILNIKKTVAAYIQYRICTARYIIMAQLFIYEEIRLEFCCNFCCYLVIWKPWIRIRIDQNRWI
jgi:hypothetical protein